MKFGVVLPLASGAPASEVLELGAAAEELGYESLWLQDDPATAGLDAVAMLAALASRTRRVRLGFSILVLPQRETAATARAIATIDAVSGGRVLLGVGVPSTSPIQGLGGSGWAVRLRYWTLAAKDTQRGPTWSVRCSDPEGRRSEHRQANAPTADSRVAATPSRQAHAYAASRVD